MLINIEIDRLNPHPNNPRKDLGDISELAESIKAHGILQNLTVIKGDHYAQDYTVVIGHRRLAAARMAGLTELPCIVSEMDEKTQIGTMLLENIQRNDLTVYEEAMGFQMMMDLGESVSSIAESTGFSESTVRRRVNLLELDRDKFEASVERGATLEDYAELSKIKDIDTRNKVLEKIGTDNFKWELKNAIENEKRDELITKLVLKLEEFAIEIKERDYQIHEYVKQYWLSNGDVEIEKPENAGEVEYFYTVHRPHCIYLYTLKTKTNESEVDPEAQAMREEQHRRESGLKEAAQQAHELRKEFVLGLTASKIKKKHSEVIEFLVYNAANNNWVDGDSLQEFLGVELECDRDCDSCEEKVGNGYEDHFDEILLSAIRNSPESALLITAYASAEDNERNDYKSQWNPYHEKNERLDRLYDLLVQLGYGMSDEEKALRDGTHELFVPAIKCRNCGKVNNGFGIWIEDELCFNCGTPCQQCGNARSHCDKCCAECEEKCNGEQRCRNPEKEDDE